MPEKVVIVLRVGILFPDIVIARLKVIVVIVVFIIVAQIDSFDGPLCKRPTTTIIASARQVDPKGRGWNRLKTSLNQPDLV